jgi:hypothetical protein
MLRSLSNSSGSDRPLSPSSTTSGGAGTAFSGGASLAALTELSLPVHVTKLLDWYLPSRLEQMVVSDLVPFCAGAGSGTTVGAGAASPSTAAGAGTGALASAGARVPCPRQFRCIALPVRTYLTFQRVGRVIEKMLSRTRKTYR